MIALGRRIAKLITALPGVQTLLRPIIRAGLLPPSVWKRLPVSGIFDVPVFDSGQSFKYVVTTPGDGIARMLFWRGFEAWEFESTSLFYELAKHAGLVLDIGANTGVYTLVACLANPHVEVIAYEPVPRVYQALLDQIQLNGLEMRCEPRNEAVSDQVTTVWLHVPDLELPTTSSIDASIVQKYPGETIEVRATTVDDSCRGREVDLVKIDVEGAEDRVLRGMLRTLQASHPAIILECIPNGPFEEVERILATFGYHFYRLAPRGPVEMPHLIPDVTRLYRNYLCVADNWRQRLPSLASAARV